MNENYQQLSVTALAVSGILTQSLSAEEINTLGLFLSIVGDILQLNSWQILKNEEKENL